MRPHEDIVFLLASVLSGNNVVQSFAPLRLAFLAVAIHAFTSWQEQHRRKWLHPAVLQSMMRSVLGGMRLTLDYPAIGKRIRKRLIHLDKPVAVFAKQAGMSAQGVCDILKGRSRVQRANSPACSIRLWLAADGEGS